MSKGLEERFDKFKIELLELFKRELLTIQDAKDTANAILEAKKMNISELVKQATRETIKYEVNGKLDNIENKIDKWFTGHLKLHEENEHKWGIRKTIAKTWDEKPQKIISFLGTLFVFTPLLLYLMVKIGEFLFKEMGIKF